MKRDCHAVAQSDCAGLVEKQDIDISRRLDRAPTHCQHIPLKHAIHARDADRTEQAADGCRNQANEQRNKNRNRKDGGGINAEWLQRHTHEQENERQRGKQNRQCDFVRRFLTARALDESNHAVEKTAAPLHRNPNDNAVAEHTGATCNRAAVATAFPNHRSGFAGDRGFIDACDSLHHIAIRRNHIARLANDEVVLLQCVHRQDCGFTGDLLLGQIG